MPPVRVGLVGGNSEKGWAAITHLPAIAAMPDLELAAVSTSNQASAELSTGRYGGRAYAGHQALIADPEVDLVVVSVKAPQHYEIASAAIEAGKPVLCEWPLGSSLEQSEELRRLAEARGVRGFVGLQGYAAAAMRTAGALVDEGYLGDLLAMTLQVSTSHFGARTPAASRYLLEGTAGANMFSIIAGHALDMAARLAGELDAVTAVVGNRRTETTLIETGEIVPMKVPDQVMVMGRLQSGAPATIHVNGGTIEPHHFSLYLSGTNGTLRLSSQAIPEIMPLTLEGTNTPGTPLAPIAVDPTAGGIPAAIAGSPAANVASLYRDIVQDLRGGTRTAPDFAHAVERHHALRAWREASDKAFAIASL